jgi:hypothetical protein
MAFYEIYTITGGGETVMVHPCFFHHLQIYTSVFTINKTLLVVARRCQIFHAKKQKSP